MLFQAVVRGRGGSRPSAAPTSLIDGTDPAALRSPREPEEALHARLTGQFGDTKADDRASPLLKTLHANEASYAAGKVFAPVLKDTLSSASANAKRVT